MATLNVTGTGAITVVGTNIQNGTTTTVGDDTINISPSVYSGGVYNGLGGTDIIQLDNAGGSYDFTTTTVVDIDWIYGGSGSDTVYGIFGVGTAVDGGGGNDSITGHIIGPNTLLGGDGDDTLTGNLLTDILRGGDGNDVLYGSGFLADVLYGDAGNDTIYMGMVSSVYAGDGSDVIVAGEGYVASSVVDLGAGDRLRIWNADFTGGTITDGNGVGLAPNSVQVNNTVPGTTILLIDTNGIAGADLTVTLVGEYQASDFTLSGTDILYGSIPEEPGPGGETPPTPTIDGVPVQQTVSGGPGSTPTQTVTIPTVQPTRTEQTGTPTAADIPVRTESGQTILQLQVPTGVGMQVQGDAAPRGAHQSTADLVRAIQARTVAGSADQQAMTGDGAGFLQGLPQDANLIIQTVVPTTATTTAPGQPIVISGPNAAGVTNGVKVPVAVVVDASGLPSGTVIQLQDVSFAAVIGAVRVTGGDGSQNVTGDGAAQYMVLGADDDTLRGGGGNDFVGSEGGDDVLYGDTGVDTVTGGIGNDILYGNQQEDLVYGGADQDTLFGGQDGDVLYGNEGADALYGNLGSDTLFGGQGDDAVFGGQGDDVLGGNLGADTLAGGLGADTFRIVSPQDGADTIADFTAGEDRIAVVGPNFGALPTGTLSAAHFALDNPTTARAMFVFNTRTGALSFDADGTGAGAAVTIATLNVRTLSHTDILVLGN